MPEETPHLSLPWRAWSWLERSTVGLPLSLLVFDIVGTWGAMHAGRQRELNVRPMDWIGWLLLIAGPVALNHRHRFPKVTLFLTLGMTLAYLLAGYTNGPI